jgi:hypothetical protein
MPQDAPESRPHVIPRRFGPVLTDSTGTSVPALDPDDSWEDDMFSLCLVIRVLEPGQVETSDASREQDS